MWDRSISRQKSSSDQYWEPRSKSTSHLNDRPVSPHNLDFYQPPMSADREFVRMSATALQLPRRGSRAVLSGSMPTSAAGTSFSRPSSLRSRAASAASGGLESSQLHLLLSNKRDSRISLNSNNSQAATGEPSSPTSVASHVGRITEPPSRKTSINFAMMRRNRGSLSSERRGSSSTLASDGSSVQSVPQEEPKEEPKKPLERQNTAPSLPAMPRALYINESVWQIDDLVYVGGLEASTNLNLLCRLNITFVLDLCDENIAEDRSYFRRNMTPCLCNCRNQHSRYLMNINVPPSERECIDVQTQTQINMNDMFMKFVEVCEKAKKAGKCALVCSNKGKNKAPAFAAAYLMHLHRISRAVAVQRVLTAMQTMRPPVNISDFLQRSLMRFQVHLGVSPDTAHDPTFTIPLFSIKRSAWT